MTRRPDGVSEALRVRVHPGVCEAWGNCHRWAPEVYPLDAEGKVDVHLIEVPPERALEAWMGAEACPAGVISIVSITPITLPPASSSPLASVDDAADDPATRHLTTTPQETTP